MSRRAWWVLSFVIGGEFLLALAITYMAGFLEFGQKLRGDFKIGFVASLWEDLFFFITAGLGVLFVQILSQKPIDFRSRMESIFGNQIPYTDSLHHRISDKFRDILAYFERVDLEIDILNISDDKKYIEMILSRRIVVGNLSKDTSAVHALRVKLTPVGGRSHGFPRLFPIETAELDSPEILNPSSKREIFPDTTISSPINESCETFEIPCGKYRWYRMSVKGWEDISSDKEVYEVLQTRYIRNVSLKLTNKTEFDIEFSAKTGKGQEVFKVFRRSDFIFNPKIEDNKNSESMIISIESIKS